MFRVLALWCLMGVAMAVPLEDQKQDQTDLVSAASRTLTEGRSDDGKGVFLPLVIYTFIILAIAMVVTTLLNELLLSLLGLNVTQVARSFTSVMADDEGMFSNVLNSIDPVDMSFRFMEIENIACRKRTLCELSAKPFIGQLFRYISPNMKSLVDFKDAMSAGEALEDCALLFAECPDNMQFLKK